MLMYNLIEQSNNYSKAFGNLCQYYKDLAESESFKSKIKMTGNNPADANAKDVKIIVPLKQLSSFGKPLKCR